MIIVLLGPPASGKGTLAQSLVEKEGWKTFSMGQALRDYVSRDGKYAHRVDHFLKSGKLVPTPMMMDVVAAHFRHHSPKKLLLDGVPRNLSQARAIENALRKQRKSIDAFIFLDASEQLIWKRIRGRRQCVKCKRIYGLQIQSKKKGVCDACGGKLIRRKDDSKKVLHERMRIYAKETLPLVEWAAQRYPVFYIDANRSPQSALKQANVALGLLR